MIAIWGYNKTHLLTDILFFRYISYSQSPELREFMRASLDPDALIVQVGCGNSKLGVNLFEDGFRFLINIDISRAVLAQMQAKYRKKHPGLAFIAGDATALGWPDACVDAIVDKGTLQSLLLLADGMAKVEAFAREVWRILRPGGKDDHLELAKVDVSGHNPEFRWEDIDEDALSGGEIERNARDDQI